MIIHTERLTISPMTEGEMVDLINRYKESNPELSTAYQEMLNSCIDYPNQYEWYCAWKISLAINQEQVGDVCFKGFNNGSPEIGYGINDEYCGMGYAIEAVTALCKWALSMPGVVSVEAETEADNEKSKRVLSRVGFIPTGNKGDLVECVLLMQEHKCSEHFTWCEIYYTTCKSLYYSRNIMHPH